MPNAPKHPRQPLFVDENGVVRFKTNAIVAHLLRAGGDDMNSLAVMEFTNEDRRQFAQLIGYSVSGYGELNYVPLREARKCDALADALLDLPPHQ